MGLHLLMHCPKSSATEKSTSDFSAKGSTMVSHNAVLVANSSVARLFDCGPLQQPWVETQDWWHAEGRQHAGDQERTPHGHSLFGRTGLAPHTDTRQRERAEFARDVAAGLQQALISDRWHTLEVFASNPFLGELLAHLSPAVAQTLRRTHPLDLTALSPQEIQKRWNKEFRI
jgi:protein required for attachment to host cells